MLAALSSLCCGRQPRPDTWRGDGVHPDPQFVNNLSTVVSGLRHGQGGSNGRDRSDGSNNSSCDLLPDKRSRCNRQHCRDQTKVARAFAPFLMLLQNALPVFCKLPGHFLVFSAGDGRHDGTTCPEQKDDGGQQGKMMLPEKYGNDSQGSPEEQEHNREVNDSRMERIGKHQLICLNSSRPFRQTGHFFSGSAVSVAPQTWQTK